MKFKERQKGHFRVLYSYSELEHLVCHYNTRDYFVDVYERNIYLIDDIDKITQKITKNGNIALCLSEEGLIIELEILLTDINLVVTHGNLICDNKELFYEYHFSCGIRGLSSLSKLMNISFSDTFKKIIDCKKNIIKDVITKRGTYEC
ncbi:MAG: hypothetical protein KatS3mg068_2487 [Candidatus Sericytochromatia bacterium]|nr:MAG: hypothetical protein KatS3mg068_2487 [Candidatus Sericytochromatia bacterium]